MTSVERIEPHGGRLTNLVCSPERIKELKNVALGLEDLAVRP